MTKKSSFIILGVICLTLILHPRLNHLLTQKFQPNTAYGVELSAVQLWEVREFNSIGSFTRVSEWPEFVIAAFPKLSSFPLTEAVAFTSDTIQSVDFLVPQDQLESLHTLMGKPLPSNRTISVSRANQTWVVGVYDSRTTQKVNGYLSDIIEADYWVHIGTKTN